MAYSWACFDTAPPRSGISIVHLESLQEKELSMEFGHMLVSMFWQATANHLCYDDDVHLRILAWPSAQDVGCYQIAAPPCCHRAVLHYPASSLICFWAPSHAVVLLGMHYSSLAGFVIVDIVQQTIRPLQTPNNFAYYYVEPLNTASWSADSSRLAIKCDLIYGGRCGMLFYDSQTGCPLKIVAGEFCWSDDYAGLLGHKTELCIWAPDGQAVFLPGNTSDVELATRFCLNSCKSLPAHVHPRAQDKDLYSGEHCCFF